MMLHFLTDEEVKTIVDALCTAGAHELSEKIENDWNESKQDLIDYADEIQQARDEYAAPSDDDLEIDDEPILSKGDVGLWVNAWVWIRHKEEEDDDEG